VLRRSVGVTSTLTLPQTHSGRAPALDFEALYRSSRDDLYAYVATIVRDRSAAEDVTAAAFERAYRKQRSFDSGRGSERAWLFGIARHAALDELRRRKRTVHLTHDPPDTAGPDTTHEIADRADVRAALGQLKVKDREIIALRYHAGLDTAEVADVLGVTETNAGTLLHRAMTNLREAMNA
jgi:RNA polymerase sigma factor (sigma-70 family)